MWIDVLVLILILILTRIPYPAQSDRRKRRNGAVQESSSRVAPARYYSRRTDGRRLEFQALATHAASAVPAVDEGRCGFEAAADAADRLEDVGVALFTVRRRGVAVLAVAAGRTRKVGAFGGVGGDDFAGETGFLAFGDVGACAGFVGGGVARGRGAGGEAAGEVVLDAREDLVEHAHFDALLRIAAGVATVASRGAGQIPLLPVVVGAGLAVHGRGFGAEVEDPACDETT